MYRVRTESEKDAVRVIELRSRIGDWCPEITEREEAEAVAPLRILERTVIDVCDVSDLTEAVGRVQMGVWNSKVGCPDSRFAVFMMARIPLGCSLGYAAGRELNAQPYQYFRDTHDWKWRTGGGGYTVEYPDLAYECSDVNLLISVSGRIDRNLIVSRPVYEIIAEEPGIGFLQSPEQITQFRSVYRQALDRIREDNGSTVTIHLYPATPNPINYEIGSRIVPCLDPTILLYERNDSGTGYTEAVRLHPLYIRGAQNEGGIL